MIKKYVTNDNRVDGGLGTTKKSSIAKKKSTMGATVTKTNRTTGKSTTTNKTLTSTSSSSFNGSGSVAKKKTATPRKKIGSTGNSSVTTPGFKPQTQKKYY